MCQRLTRRTWVWLFGGLLLTSMISAEEPEAPTVKDVLEQQEEVEAEGEPSEAGISEGPEDEYGRGTPHSSIQGLAEALRRGDYTGAAHYLDLRNLPGGLEASRGRGACPAAAHHRRAHALGRFRYAER